MCKLIFGTYVQNSHQQVPEWKSLHSLNLGELSLKMSLCRKEIEVFPSFSSAVEVFCPFFRRRVCSLKVTSLPFELVVLFFVQGSREILLMFLLLLFTLSCTMEELASQGTNFPYQRRKLMALSPLRSTAPVNFYQPLSQRMGRKVFMCRVSMNTSKLS